ncbi:Uncharacterised protein [Yersinia enterocolitica]|nr:Uncharacterised protein [Yersinia enterocolitica]
MLLVAYMVLSLFTINTIFHQVMPLSKTHRAGKIMITVGNLNHLQGN